LTFYTNCLIIGTIPAYSGIVLGSQTMADDGQNDDRSDDEPVLVPKDKKRKKGESGLGNFLEAVLTYGSGFFIYLPVNALLIFGPWEFDTPEAQAVFWPFWIAFSLAYDSTNRYAANMGIRAKFASKSMRLFADFIASASPVLIPIFMIVLGFLRQYSAQGIDLYVALFMMWFASNDLFGNSDLVQTALRRISEVVKDR
jgi:hypothetical protein